MDALQQRIVGFETWHLALPVTSTRDHGVGRVSGSCEIIVLALTLEDGTTGWGEASPWVVFTGSPEASHAALTRYIKPHVVGRKLADHPAIMADADRAVAHCTEAKAALDTALFDLTGQVLGCPVHTLLSEQEDVPNSVALPLSVSLANPDWDADLALLARLREDGVRIVKLKTGFRDHAFDMMRLNALARDFPEFAVRVDYNQGLGRDEAEARVRDVAGFTPDFIEQPVRAARYAEMAHLRTVSSVPLLADESVFGLSDMARAHREKACDGVSIKIMKSGGLTAAQRVASFAHEGGLLAYGGDMFEAGIAHLAGAHMVAATPEITLGCEFYQAKYYLVEDILETPIDYFDGHIQVPTTPGLGRTPDRDKLKKYAI